MNSLFYAQSVQFSYHSDADRIMLLFDAQQSHRVWLTRRYLTQLLPRMADWLNKTAVCKSIDVTTESVRLAISEFEHASAKSQIKTEKEQGGRGANIERPKATSREYLSTMLQLQTQKNKVLVQFGHGKVFESAILLQRSELHKLLGCLLGLANDSGWSVDSPWQSVGLVAH
jgi:hypothetical protein